MKSEKDINKQLLERMLPRWLIIGRLVTTSPLHVGDGSVKKGRAQGSEASSLMVAATLRGTPFIPGTTLKGAVRRFLRPAMADNDKLAFFKMIFGYSEEVSVGDEQVIKGYAGRAEFHDALADRGGATVRVPPPHWEGGRLTGLAASVALDRRTRSALDKHLFLVEFVPPGVAFDVAVTSAGLGEEHVAWLLAGLRGAAGVGFGAATADGWGRLEWHDEKVQVLCLGAEQVGSWLAGERPPGDSSHARPGEVLENDKPLHDQTSVYQIEKCGFAGLDDFGIDVTPMVKEQAGKLTAGICDNADGFVLKLHLQMDGPFLVNDPSRAKPKEQSAESGENTDRNAGFLASGTGTSSIPSALSTQPSRLGISPQKDQGNGKPEAEEDSRPNFTPLVDADGHPCLPVSSLRGALRAQAERIARTIGGDGAACRHGKGLPSPDKTTADEKPPAPGDKPSPAVNAAPPGHMRSTCCDGGAKLRNLQRSDLKWEVPLSTDEKKKLKDALDGLCPVCRLFGAPGWRSPLRLETFFLAQGQSAEAPMAVSRPHDLVGDNDPAPTSAAGVGPVETAASPPPAPTTTTNAITPFPRQDFVGLDRFTGGGARSVKFDAEYAWRPGFQITLRLDPDRLELIGTEPSLGLLALVLRDLAEGDIPLGFGAAKGYGACSATPILAPADTPETLEGVASGGSRDIGQAGPAVSPSTVLAAFLAGLGQVARQPADTEFDSAARQIRHWVTALEQRLRSKAPAIDQPLPPAPPDLAAAGHTGQAPSPSPEPTGRWTDGNPNRSPDTSFHNPYHFVPVTGDINGWTNRPEFDKGGPFQATHDRYVGGAYSGRIICRLTAETPLFIGAGKPGGKKDPARAPGPAAGHQADPPARHQGQPEQSNPGLPELTFFKLNGQPAVPASSLRGLVSSIAEAASDSALRVLADQPYSYRMEMRAHPPQALGMIDKRQSGSTEQYFVIPLALPPIPLGKDEKGKTVWDPKWSVLKLRLKHPWNRIFKKPVFPIYVNGYQKAGEGEGIVKKDASFLQKSDPVSYSADHQQIWYLKADTQVKQIGQDFYQICSPNVKVDERSGDCFLLGQKAMSDAVPIAGEVYKGGDECVKGILRILNTDDHLKEIPSTKKHEIFVPYDPAHPAADPIDANEAVAKFHQLADERTEERAGLPIELKGMCRTGPVLKKKGPTLRLRTGDLVFFSPDRDDPKRVKEVSISSIWRRGAGGGSHDYFREISAEKLPFNPGRKLISPAELLFGFVEDMKIHPTEEHEKNQNTPSRQAALALAGRVRFSNGVLAAAGSAAFAPAGRGSENASIGIPKPATAVPPGGGKTTLSTGRSGTSTDLAGPFMDAVSLKALLSPKTPCPAFYFKSKNTQRSATSGGNQSDAGLFITKEKLNPKDHHPQGRKFYLHHPAAYSGGQPWKTEKENPDSEFQHAVRPLRSGTVFYFQVDFANLTAEELGMLGYALRPDDAFRHKLGMGRAIGLGSVRLDPMGVFYVDRARRYSTFGCVGPRHHCSWRPTREELAALITPFVPSGKTVQRPAGWPGSAEGRKALAETDAEIELVLGNAYPHEQAAWRQPAGGDESGPGATPGVPVKVPDGMPTVAGGNGQPPVRRALERSEAMEYRFFILREAFGQSMNSDIRRALELLGDPASVRHPVHTPRGDDGQEEEKNYEWWMENDFRISQCRDKGRSFDQPPQWLAPLGRDIAELTILKRWLRPQRHRPGKH